MCWDQTQKFTESTFQLKIKTSVWLILFLSGFEYGQFADDWFISDNFHQERESPPPGQDTATLERQFLAEVSDWY